MKTNIFYFFLSLLLLVSITSCNDEEFVENDTPNFEVEIDEGQEPHVHSRSCGHEEHVNGLMQDPTYAKEHQEKITKVENYLKETAGQKVACANPKTLPVAVHYQGINNPNESCLIALAQTQVDILNDDFAATNSDISKWTNGAASNYPGVNLGEACIQFMIANTNHPSGYGLSNGDLAVTFNQTNGDQDNKWSGYMNIYVQFGTGVLGYAPLGGRGNGDGVVIEATAFGAGSGCGTVSPEAPFNLGRTTTHEVGHYLLLDHLWGNGGCNSDDSVTDTPNQTDANYDCPGVNTSSCNSKDLHMSYMDYSNDACMYMFSAGQVSRMTGYVNSSLSNLTSNAANVIDGNTTGGGNDGNDDGDDGTTPSACDKPTNSSVSNITTTSAIVSWAASTDVTRYQIRYRSIGGSWTTEALTETFKTITNLSENTTYEYQIRTLCPSGWTERTSAQTFTTLDSNTGGNTPSSCAKPTSTSVSNVTQTSAKVSWTEMPDKIRYRIRYRKAGTTSWTYKSGTANSKTLTGLTANTNYEYQIRTKCSSGWTDYTSLETFKTLSNSGGGTNNGCEGTEITFELILDDYGSETSWELTKANGARVETGGPYADGQSGKKITKTFCLVDGCYTMYVDDAYGDGICCDYGNGSFRILSENGSVLASSDGYFGTYDYLDFCVDGNGFRQTGGDKDAKKTNLARKGSSN